VCLLKYNTFNWLNVDKIYWCVNRRKIIYLHSTGTMIRPLKSICTSFTHTWLCYLKKLILLISFIVLNTHVATCKIYFIFIVIIVLICSGFKTDIMTFITTEVEPKSELCGTITKLSTTPKNEVNDHPSTLFEYNGEF